MSSQPTSAIIATNQCQHLSPRGQHCRMLRVNNESLCPYHLRQTQALSPLANQPDPETLAAELLAGTGNLNTAERVNALLANVAKQLARQRISRRDALALGYLAQLLLNTVPAIHKEQQAERNAEAQATQSQRAHEAQQARIAHHDHLVAQAQSQFARARGGTGIPACAPATSTRP